LAWIPAISAGAGTPTTVTTAAYYKIEGNKFQSFFDITVVDKGTASGAVVLTSPFAYAIATSGSGREISATGKGTAISAAAAGALSMTLYDFTTLWVNGYRIIVQIYGFID